MEILLLCYQTARGGNFVRAKSLGVNLARREHRVTLLVAASRPRLWVCHSTQEGISVLEMPDFLPRRLRHGGLSPIDVMARFCHVAAHRYDVVHAFEHRPSVFFPALLARYLRDAVYVSDWGDLWGFPGIAQNRPLHERFLLGFFDHVSEPLAHRLSDGVTTISQYLKGRVEMLGIAQGRILILPPGCNVDTIRPLPKDSVRREYGLPLDARIAVCAGFSEVHADYLADAFVRVARAESKARLLVTGAPWKKVSEILKRAGFEERFIAISPHSYEEYGRLLSCGDVMLVPYLDSEMSRARFPSKTADYLAAGRPIVTNRSGDLGKMTEQESVGLIADPTPDAFAEKILLLFTDASLREAMGSCARKFAENRLSWSLLAEQVERFYRSLLECAGPAASRCNNGTTSQKVNE